MFTIIEVPDKAPLTEQCKELVNYCKTLKETKGLQGEQLLNGKLIQSKLASKAANMLYRDLVRAIARKKPEPETED